jgi:acyl-CoA thioester hydrolase
MLQSRSLISVRYAETDMMGVVYHGSYLPWFEVARTDLLKQHGIPYRALEAEGYFLPVISLEVKYRQPARYDDTIEIIATLREKPALRIRIQYEVRHEGVLLATGSTEHVFIDRQGKAVRPPASFVSRMNEAFR